MKNVYLIGGTMGVGKTAACQSMKGKLNSSVFLDGDWCWDMHPFQVSDETKTRRKIKVRSRAYHGYQENIGKRQRHSHRKQ